MPYRAVKDLDLAEVSILDRSKTPAYDGTLISARSEEEPMHFRGEDFIDEVIVNDETPVEESKEEVREELIEAEPKQQEVVKEIDYSKYENMLKEMKEE